MLNCNPILPTPLLPPEPYLLISGSFSHPPHKMPPKEQHGNLRIFPWK